MIDRVSKPPPLAFMSSPEDNFIQRIEIFLEENGILDLSGKPEEDVELEKHSPDEKLLGPLTPYEKNCFVLSSLLNAVLEDYTVEKQAGDYEKITALMRERKVPFHVAATLLGVKSDQPPEEERLFMNRSAITHTHLVMAFEWSVRQRYNAWLPRIIVREGFVAYAYE